MTLAVSGHEAQPPRFQRLFDENFTYVWNSLRRLGVREADREDLLQEVFVRVHNAFASYDPSRPPKPWLFAFAFRVASDYRRLKRHRVETPASENHEPPSLEARPDETLEASQRRALLHRALDELDLDKRAVVILHELEGLPIPEVAEALAIPVGTASSRLRAARAELASTLRVLSRERAIEPKRSAS